MYNLINVEQITNIKICEKNENQSWYYSSKSINRVNNLFRKLFGNTPLETIKYGYILTIDIDDEFCIEEEVLLNEPNCYIENNVVYYKPYLTINLSNGKYYTKYFENVESMNMFLIDNNLTKFIKI